MSEARVRMAMLAAGTVLIVLAHGARVTAQELDLPPRRDDALGGSEVARQLRSLELEAREERVYSEIARGNVPDWLRALRPVELVRGIQGRVHRVTFWVTPDYLAVGSDDDYFLVPLSPQTAQRIGDAVGASLPTPSMVDAIWASAAVRLGPDSIAPSARMTTVPVFEDHDARVRARRRRDATPLGALVAGHKKDVVLTAELDTRPGRVAIYGWHRPDGTPIQPLYTGHSDRWVDYSHGIRLVAREVLIDGVRHDIVEVLRDLTLAPLLTDGGAIAEPRYPVGLGSGEQRPTGSGIGSVSTWAVPCSRPRGSRTGSSPVRRRANRS